MRSKDILLLVGGLAIGATACATKPKPEPFTNAPQNEGAGCGTALLDLSGVKNAQFDIPINSVGAGDIEAAFTAGGSYVGAQKNLRLPELYPVSSGPRLYSDLPWNWSDRTAVAKEMLQGQALVYDIRFGMREPILLKILAAAPVMVDGQPQDRPLVPQVVAMELNGKEDWLGNLTESPLCPGETSQHVVDIIKAVGFRLEHASFWKSEDPILAAAIVPSRYAADVKSALASGQHLANVVNDVRLLSANEGIPVANDYVTVVDSEGNPTLIRLPLGAEVEILEIRQLPSGKVVALVNARARSYLVGYLNGDESLVNDAKFNMPQGPVWVDVMDVQVEPPEQAGTAQAGENTLARALATSQPTATPEMTQTPLPTPTPEPTRTAQPSPTPIDSFTNVQPQMPGKTSEDVQQEKEVLTRIVFIIGILGLLGFSGVLWAMFKDHQAFWERINQDIRQHEREVADREPAPVQRAKVGPAPKPMPKPAPPPVASPKPRILSPEERKTALNGLYTRLLALQRQIQKIDQFTKHNPATQFQALERERVVAEIQALQRQMKELEGRG